MGVLEGERGKGVGRRMIEEVKKKAEADRLPIIVNANREAVGFYKRCGFSTLGMFTYVGESRENHIMQWVWETTIKGEH
jgi:GNAT superfamily N-acetyltransferase